MIMVSYITAQMGIHGLRAYSIGGLYKNREFIRLYAAMVTGLMLILASYLFKPLVVYTLPLATILSIHIMLLTISIGQIQFENMKYGVIALKIVRRLSTRFVLKWHLAKILRSPSGEWYLHREWDPYETAREDPLRGVHDIVTFARDVRDSHLLGQIVALLYGRISLEFGVGWSRGNIRGPVFRCFKKITFRNLSRSKFSSAQLSLHILHYLRRIPRNLQREWRDYQSENPWDESRYAIQHQAVELWVNLCRAGVETPVKFYLLNLLYYVSQDFKGVPSYEKQEPLLYLEKVVLESGGSIGEIDITFAIAVMEAIRRSSGHVNERMMEDIALRKPEEFASAMECFTKHDYTHYPLPKIHDPWAK